MAANKFATMLHRNTNKMVVILVYVVLEWLLIVLLLLNSFFSYLITRFAIFFGLQQPCLLCSRVDHVLQPGKKKSSSNLDKDLVCEAHAAEISKLGYCSNHQRLAEAQSMCEDCLASRPNHHEHSIGMRHRIGFISWVNHEKNDEEEVENTNKCSCCDESLRSQLYPPCLLLKPSWGDDDDGNFTGKGSLIVESIDDDEKGGGDSKGIEFERNNGEEDHDDEHQILSDIESFILREVAEDRSSSVSNLQSDEKDIAEKDEKEDYLNITEMDPSGSGSFMGRFADDSAMKASFLEDRSIEVINVQFENEAACDDRRLVPVKFIDSITCMHFESYKIDEDLAREQEIETFAHESPIESHSSIIEGEALLKMDKNKEKTSIGELESLENSIVLEIEEFKKDSVAKVHPETVTTEDAETMLNDDNIVKAASEEQDNTQVDQPLTQEPTLCSHESTKEDESSTDDGSSTDDESSTSEDDTEVQNAFDAFLAQNNLSESQSLSNVDNSIEEDMEEPDDSPIDNLPPSEEPASSCQCIAEDQSSESEDDTGVVNAFDEFIAQNNLCEDKTGANDTDYAETIEKTVSADENHEEKGHQSSKCSEAGEEKLPETPTSPDGLHYRKLMIFDKRESGAEDSVDGSVASELEYGGDPSSTIDRLKTALKSERKALSAIYQELEEERSASAVAANQTMAMITRLQEEKAAMQMEALQYQRMMEEQAEYDQEALQLLNELMLKREKEKQELEKELEEYRHKVMDYEAREKLRVLKRMKDGSGSGSTRSRDGDRSGDDLSVDLSRQENVNAETVTDLEGMALECVNHISAFDDSLAEFEEERASILDQLRALEEKIISLEENEELIDENCNYGSTPEDNVNNDFSDENAKHLPRRTMGSLAKTLLPYLDAAENEAEESVVVGDVQLEDSVDDAAAKVSIEEEVDRVYERLQALETDREFLQHCMGSIQNGDKGVDLLQEILQHLRDLKAVEVRLKNLGSDPLE